MFLNVFGGFLIKNQKRKVVVFCPKSGSSPRLPTQFVVRTTINYQTYIMVLLRYVFSSCKETMEPIRGPLLLVYPQQTTRYLNTHPAAINNVYIVHTFDSKGSGLSIYLQHRPIETIYKYIHICTYTYIYPYGHIFIMRERRDNVKIYSFIYSFELCIYFIQK